MASTRLTPDHWLTAGFAALIADGPVALAAEPLARAMGTTKGSFYWHFKDVPAFHAALITAWRAGAIQSLQDAVADQASPEQRLRQFGATQLADDREAALRIWARSNPAVSVALQAVDAEREIYLTLLLRELGFGNADFARALQACLIGLPQLTAQKANAAFDTLVDTILALS